MTDDAIKAAASVWWKADAGSWKFAELAAPLAGQDGATKKLAAAIQRTEDTVQGYVAAWLLFEHALQYMSRDCPIDSESLRESLSVQHWVTVGRKWKNHWFDDDPVRNSEEAFNLLVKAKQCHWTVEDLRKNVPHNSVPMDWGEAVTKARKFIESNVISAPTLGVEEWRYEYTVRAWKLFEAVQDAPDEETAKQAWEERRQA